MTEDGARPRKAGRVGAAGLTRREVFALGCATAVGVASGGGRARAEARLTAAPGAETALVLGAPVARVDILPPDPARLRRRFRPSRAGLEAGGGHIYRVTRRDDGEGLGTLRHAVTSDIVNDPGRPTHRTASAGPRVVIFDVGGRFPTRSILRCRRPRTWIAGQTAPGPVTLHGFAVSVEASDVVIQHLSNVLRRPEDPAESETARCFAVVGRDAPIESVWIDHCTGLGSADQSTTLWAGADGAHRVDNVVFSHCIFGMPQRAAPRDGDPSPYHEATHAFGMLSGSFTSCALIECGMFGMEARSPQISRGASALFANFYSHDYFNWATWGGGYGPSRVAPLLLSGTIWKGYDARLAEVVAPDDRGSDIACVGSYAEPGWFTHARIGRVKRISGRMLALDANGGPHNVFEEGNRIEVGPPIDEGALGPDGAAIAHPPTRGIVFWRTPPLWSETLPTHASAIRARVLESGGAQARRRDPTVADYLERVRAQAAKRWETGEREPLFLEDVAPPPPAPDLAAGAWAPPTAPFAIESNGLTAIENALHARGVELGGARFGNLDRPLHAPGGGALTVRVDGTVTWRAGVRGADPVEAVVTLADGERVRLTLAAA